MITIELISQINDLLGVGGLFGIVAVLALTYDLKSKRLLTPYVQQWGMYTALAATLLGSVLTLIYSDVLGFVPCGLCWFERIMLYPQVLLIGTALWIHDKVSVLRYGIVLSSFGLLISLYHHYIQMGGTAFAKCPAAGAGADCAKRFFFEYNFMTFPFLAVILFAFLIMLYRYMLKTNTSSAQ